MPRPEPAEYNQSIQSPKLCFADPELRSGLPELDGLGLPRAVSGAFASVYQMHCGRRTWAVRCFLREFTDQEQRYGEIARHLATAGLPYTVGFEFQARGIRVGGRWHPILKMEWVQGEPLNAYMQRHLHDQASMRRLADRWLEMMRALGRSGIAHGDLQPGNVMVVNGDLRLIDYDGMYVPALSGLPSHEVGHRDYQSPSRSASHTGSYLDNFSAWVIYLSLLAFSEDPGLGTHVAPDAEHLIFSKADFDRPGSSKTFRDLQRLQDPEIQALVPVFRSFVSKDPSLVPPLARDMHRHGASPSARTGPLPSWIDEPPPVRALAADTSRSAATSPWGAADWMMEHLRHRAIVPVDAAQSRWVLSWLIPVACASLLIGGSLTAPVAFSDAVGALGLVLLLLLVLLIRYLTLPEVSQMLSAWIELRVAEIMVWFARDALARIEEQQRALGPSAQRLLTELEGRQLELDRREQEELCGLDRDLDTTLQSIDVEEKASWGDQLTEIGQALQDHQDRYLAAALARVSLSRANIRGVSPELQHRLDASGITTALDLADIRDVQTGHAVADQETHIGPAEAGALEDWQCEVETHAREGMPRSLPSGVVGGISTRYRNKRRGLEQRRSNALKQATAGRDGTRRRYAQRRARLARRIVDVRDRLEQQGLELDRKKAAQVETLRRRHAAADVARQRLGRCRAVSPKDYLWSLLRSNKQVDP
jgi:hypothetical protein